MTLTPDRLDDLDFEFDPLPEEAVVTNLPERFNNANALVLRAEDPPQATFTMTDWREAMDEMENGYRAFQAERESTWTNIVQAPEAEPHVTADMIYDAVREIADRDVQLARRRQQIIEEQRYRDFMGRSHYCYCSPGRGMFFERYGEAEFAAYRPPGVYADSRPGPRLAEAVQAKREEIEDSLTVTYHRWEPTPEPSKELVRIADDVDPLPDSERPEETGSLAPILVGVGISVLVAFVACANLALAFMG